VAGLKQGGNRQGPAQPASRDRAHRRRHTSVVFLCLLSLRSPNPLMAHAAKQTRPCPGVAGWRSPGLRRSTAPPHLSNPSLLLPRGHPRHRPQHRSLRKLLALAAFSFVGVPALLDYLSDAMGVEWVPAWTTRTSMDRVPASGDRRSQAPPATDRRNKIDRERRCGADMWVRCPPQLLHHQCCQLIHDERVPLVRIVVKMLSDWN
jgi:hypothetical protein